jgi:hypothetical protein
MQDATSAEPTVNYQNTKRKKAIVNYLGCECPLWYRCSGEPHGKTTWTRDETEASAFVLALDMGQVLVFSGPVGF